MCLKFVAKLTTPTSRDKVHLQAGAHSYSWKSQTTLRIRKAHDQVATWRSYWCLSRLYMYQLLSLLDGLITVAHRSVMKRCGMCPFPSSRSGRNFSLIMNQILGALENLHLQYTNLPDHCQLTFDPYYCVNIHNTMHEVLLFSNTHT